MRYPVGTKVLDKDGKVLATLVRDEGNRVIVSSTRWHNNLDASEFYTDNDKKIGRTLKFPTKAIIEEYYGTNN
jgi:hypothetical protein